MKLDVTNCGRMELEFFYARLEVTYRLYVYPGYALQGALGKLYAMLYSLSFNPSHPTPGKSPS